VGGEPPVLDAHKQVIFGAAAGFEIEAAAGRWAISTTAMPSPVTAPSLTAERVLVHADTSVHPDLLNSRFGHVSISRASHEATLFTDDMAKLGSQLGADVSKTSALEVSEGPSVAQGMGVGL
jgi:hypothetical protein